MLRDYYRQSTKLFLLVFFILLLESVSRDDVLRNLSKAQQLFTEITDIVTGFHGADPNNKERNDNTGVVMGKKIIWVVDLFETLLLDYSFLFERIPHTILASSS